MKLVKVFLLVVLPVALLLPAETDGHHTGDPLTYSDLLVVFRGIAQPYEAIKTDRNKKMDSQVNIVISRIMSVLPELATVHNYIQNLSLSAPALTSRIGNPLVEIKQSLQVAIQELSSCHPRGVLIADAAESSLSESDEDIAESVGEPIYQHKKSRRNVAGIQEIGELFAPVISELSKKLNETLRGYNENAVVSLRDAAEAFQAMANVISNEHASRFNSLVPKIAAVNEATQTISDYVQMIKGCAADLYGQATLFMKSTVGHVHELVNLTSTIQGLTSSVC